MELGYRAGGAILVAAAIALWRVTKPALRTLAQFILALVIMFEEWGWEPLARGLGYLARVPVIASVERVLANLPPYGALAAFAVPGLLLIPVKLLAVYLFASGYWLKGVVLLTSAKLASTAIVARIYHLTQPALLQIGWFNSLHARFIPWKDATFAYIRSSPAWRLARAVKDRVRRLAGRFKRRIARRLAELRVAILVRTRAAGRGAL